MSSPLLDAPTTDHDSCSSQHMDCLVFGAPLTAPAARIPARSHPGMCPPCASERHVSFPRVPPRAMCARAHSGHGAPKKWAEPLPPSACNPPPPAQRCGIWGCGHPCPTPCHSRPPWLAHGLGSSHTVCPTWFFIPAVRREEEGAGDAAAAPASTQVRPPPLRLPPPI